MGAVVATAGTIAVPGVPEVVHIDTESMTNAPVRTSLIQRARTFSGDIALFAPPIWLFARDWDMVRVTLDGMDATAESVSIRLDNDPWLFITR